MILEDLKKIISESNNFSEVLRKLNLKVSNGNYVTLKNLIQKNQINISHFNRKVKKNNSGTKRELVEILTENSHYNITELKRRLIFEKLKEHKCENCLQTEWLGKPIPIQLHHINGNNHDNQLCNLQILCPNCHSLTDNYCSKNIKIKRKNILKYVINPKKYINSETLLSWFKDCNTYQCVSLKQNIPLGTLKNWIKTENLINEVNNILKKNKNIISQKLEEKNILICALVDSGSFLGAAKILNLSDNGVKKRCKKYNLPTTKKELIKFISGSVLVDSL
jgi:hypothetical protein